MNPDLTHSINSLRVLSIDMISYAKSGHPGICLGAAPIIYSIYANHLKINPKASVSGLQVTVDNSKLYVKCKIVCEMSVKESRKMHIVEEMTTNVSENQEKHCGIVTVYYPDKNDTLWEIAKKYRKSMASIAEENMLSSDCLADGGTVKLEDIERIIITKNI